MSERLEKKIDDVISALSDVRTDVARLSTIEQHREKTSARFWSDTWPRIEKLLNDHEGRITVLERFEWSKMADRMNHLENWQARSRGYLAGATAVAAFVGGIASWLIKYLANR